MSLEVDIKNTLDKMPKRKRLEAAIGALKKLLMQDFLAFCYFLGYEAIDPQVHGEMVFSLMDDAKKRIICVPRGTFKSTIAAVCYPLWRLVRNPDLRVLIDSELYGNSVTYLRSIKGHMRESKVTKVFGEFRTKHWNADSIVISQRTKVWLKEPSITCGGIGTTKVGQHYDLIIGDDYNSPKNMATLLQQEKVISHYKYNLSILEPQGEYIVIGTRYGENDVIGWLLREILDEKDLSEGNLKNFGGSNGG